VTDPNLGRLTTVPPRDVWPHEALNFTPWLLANVDVLSELLGMDLVLEVAEHPVGGFSLDLLGRDLSDDSVVIVENQLDASDHGHLGQILTYAAGTNPTTIVWINTGFRPEHRAALDWLNEHTGPETRFFGVEIEVVRIGESAPAPNFKIAVEPNDWEKQVKAGTAAGASEVAKLYSDFWEQFRARVVSEHPDWTNQKTSNRGNWYGLPTGLSAASLDSTFTRQGLAVQLNFGGPDPSINTARFEALHERRQQFEQALGEQPVWDDLAGRKSARVSFTSEFSDVTDVDQWAEMIAWLLDQHVRFRRAIQAAGGLGSLS